MHTQTQTMNRHDSRRDARAQVRSWHAFAAVSGTGVVPMVVGTLTAKINPCWVPGGLPKEGNP
jgi:hypothetical protein